jgi:predicted RNase H-like nuclease
VSIAAAGPPEPSLSLAPSLAPVVASGEYLAVDIPIGLPEWIEGPGRAAEQAVRPHLGERQSSVFSMPSRAAVHAQTYEAACSAALATSDPPRKVSRQAFLLFPKVRELDALLTRANQARVFEVHAEMAFWRLNGQAPMATPKRVKGVPVRDGLSERIALIEAHGFPPGWFDDPRPPGLPLVDVVDAAAIALVARRCAAGTARPFPDPPDTDARGLRVAIWA